MAGKIIADTIEASGSQISLNVGNVTVFTASSTGLATANITTANIASISGAVVATQANQETATSTTTLVTPGRQQYHPSAVKAWVQFKWVSGTPTIGGSYNVTSLSDTAVGQTLVTLTTPFSASGTYGVALGYQTAAQASQQQFDTYSLLTGSFSLRYASNGTDFDSTNPMTAIAVGDQ